MSEEVKRYKTHDVTEFYSASHGDTFVYRASIGEEWILAKDYDTLSAPLKESERRLQEVRVELEREKESGRIMAQILIGKSEEISRLLGELSQANEMVNLSAELLPVPEHNQGDDWYEKQSRINEYVRALAARSDAKPDTNQ